MLASPAVIGPARHRAVTMPSQRRAPANATPSRVPPGLIFSTRRRALLVASALAPLTACSPALNFRELRFADARCAIALPGKPQTVEREVELSGRKLQMAMTSTGVGATLFALGRARLPAEAVAPEALAQTVAFFRDGLLRNFRAAPAGAPGQPPPLATPPGRVLRAAQAVSAQGQAPDGKPTALAARFYVVDDWLLQVVALAVQGELGAQALDTFFDSFRLVD
jgi:hypothetical protein